MSQYPPQYPVGQPPQNHPQATTILVLGILGLVLCQVLGPFAWSMGNKALREIDGAQGAIGGRETVNIGRILGMIATALLGLAILLVLFFVVIAAFAASTSA